MKKILLIALAVLLCLALCVPASASMYESVAEELADAGLMKGTGSSFELDRAPNRVEAAAMIVRLYGAEEEAAAEYAAGKITHPFTDVPEWAAPYVAWLCSKGLTRGISDTEFGSANLCSGHDYAVFMLRALGYEDDVDFTYADGADFAEELGFYSSLLYSGEFLRDDMTAVTYQALVTDVKDSTQTLVETLAESGAVTEAAAKELLDKAAVVKELQALLGEDITALDADIKAAILIKDGQDDENINMDGKLKLLAPDKNDLMTVSLASLLKIAMDDEAFDLDIWLNEGWIYINLVIGEEELPLKLDLSFVTDLMGEMYEDGSMPNIPEELTVTLFDSVEKEISGNDTIFVCKMSGDTISGLIAKLTGEDAEDIMAGYDIENVEVVYTFTNGELKSVEESFSMTYAAYDEDDEDYSYSIDALVLIGVNSIGNDVSIEYPDFSGYIDILSLLDSMPSELDAGNAEAVFF